MTAQVDAAAVEAARERLREVIPPSPLERSDRLSARLGAQVWLKREDLLVVRSYKLRGAYNLMSQLGARERGSGVVAASAGNHGQGLARACGILGIHGRVFVPRTTPRQKRERIAQLGGSLVQLRVVGGTYDEAAAAAADDARETGATLVPAFDDPRTIAGQGTVIAEAVEQLGAVPDVVVAPVGGGGLLAGCLAWLWDRHPGVRVVGAEPQGAACMAAAVRAGGPVSLAEIDTFVDGAAVRRAGDFTYPIVRDTGPELVAVPEGRVCSEMLELYQLDGIIAEPAGALATAALGHHVSIARGATVIAVLSGGNNDVARYAEVIERALVHEGRKHYFLVDFPQEPGALRRFLDEVLGPDDDIALFEYVKRSNREVGPALVGIELGRPEDLDPLLDRMRHSPVHTQRVPPDSPIFRFLT